MTEIQLKQLESKCNAARFLSSNILSLNRLKTTLKTQAIEHGGDENSEEYLNYLRYKKIPIIYCGYDICFTGYDFLNLIESTIEQYNQQFEDLKICECEECKS